MIGVEGLLGDEDVASNHGVFQVGLLFVLLVEDREAKSNFAREGTYLWEPSWACDAMSELGYEPEDGAGEARKREVGGMRRVGAVVETVEGNKARRIPVSCTDMTYQRLRSQCPIVTSFCLIHSQRSLEEVVTVV